MTATSPFYRAVTPAVREKGLGRRTVLVDPPKPPAVPVTLDESPAVAESAEVAGEQANRSGATYAETIRRRYEQWRAAAAVGLDPIAALDPIHECPHGKLPEDRVQICACWRPGAALQKTEEEPMQAVPDVQATAPANEAAPPSEEAPTPIRTRKDGSPDRRYLKRSNGSGGSRRRHTPTRTPAALSAPVAAPESPTVAKMLRELDAELDALHRARAALLQAVS